MQRTICQIARAGDILSILPVLRHWHVGGDDVGMIVHRDYLPMFRHIPYVSPIEYTGSYETVPAAIDYAQSIGCANILATQVDGNPERRNDRNFIMDQWSRTGEQARFHDLPLVLVISEDDRRSVDHLVPDGDGPVLGYCLSGISSPFPAAIKLQQWISRRFCGHRLIDLGSIKLDSVCGLLPILEQCAVLVAVDSAILHLGYATLTPTIALQPDNPWLRSEPRKHWIDAIPYSETMTDDGKRRIEAAIQ